MSYNYNKENEEHIRGLDLLRGLSCYFIVVCHYFAFSYDHVFSEYLSLIFVEFFFVLSGFVLFPQLIRIFENKKNLGIFYIRRFLRTLPLYFVCLIIISLMFNEFVTLDFLKYFFFIQDLTPNFLSKNYYTIVWSLSIEEFFYLLFPLFLAFAKKENYLRYSIYLFIFLILIKIPFIDNFDTKFLRTGTLFRLDAILLGFLLRHIYTKINFFYSAAISLFFLLIYFFLQDFFISNKDLLTVKFSFVFLLQLISGSVLLFFCNIENFMKSPVLRKFATLSANQAYSLYLIHLIFIYILKDLSLENVTKFSIYIALIFVSSTVIFYFFEKPILKMRPRLLKE